MTEQEYIISNDIARIETMIFLWRKTRLNPLISEESYVMTLRKLGKHYKRLMSVLDEKGLDEAKGAK